MMTRLEEKIITEGYKPLGIGKYYEKWITPVKRLHLINEGNFVKIHIDIYRRRNNWKRLLDKSRIFRKEHRIIRSGGEITRELEKFNL